MSHSTCGAGAVAWNTVASSPFAKEFSVDSWEELPALLDRLLNLSDEYTNKLQVKVHEMDIDHAKLSMPKLIRRATTTRAPVHRV